MNFPRGLRYHLLVGLGALSLIGCAHHAAAAPPTNITNTVGVCDPNNPQHCAAPDSGGNLPVSGTFSATLSSFAPSTSVATTQYSVTTSSQSSALPTGTSFVLQNIGTTNPVCFNFSAGSGSVTTATAVVCLPPTGAINLATSLSNINYIATGGATTLNVTPGTGLAAFGGGSVQISGTAAIYGTLNTTGGWTAGPNLTALTATVIQVKGAAGQLGMAYCYNPNTSVAFVQVFDAATAGSVTLGSTTPKYALPIPAGSNGGYALALVGLQFASGIQVAATTTATGSTAPSTALVCNSAYN